MSISANLIPGKDWRKRVAFWAWEVRDFARSNREVDPLAPPKVRFDKVDPHKFHVTFVSVEGKPETYSIRLYRSLGEWHVECRH